MTESVKPQVWLNEFAKRSFRDIADRDYIAARMSYRAGLDEPFLWSALQAFEKYFKAIHLYNGMSVIKFGHDIVKLMESVKQIPDIQLELPEDVENFICYLNDYGSNRYLEFPSSVRLNALLELDRSIWHVRRYCQYMRSEFPQDDGSTISQLPYLLTIINDEAYIERPYQFRLFAGYLEKVIKDKSDASPYLIWKNFYYGRQRKKVIMNFKERLVF